MSNIAQIVRQLNRKPCIKEVKGDIAVRVEEVWGSQPAYVIVRDANVEEREIKRDAWAGRPGGKVSVLTGEYVATVTRAHHGRGGTEIMVQQCGAPSIDDVSPHMPAVRIRPSEMTVIREALGYRG